MDKLQLLLFITLTIDFYSDLHSIKLYHNLWVRASLSRSLSYLSCSMTDVNWLSEWLGESPDSCTHCYTTHHSNQNHKSHLAWSESVYRVLCMYACMYIPYLKAPMWIKICQWALYTLAVRWRGPCIHPKISEYLPKYLPPLPRPNLGIGNAVSPKL